MKRASEPNRPPKAPERRAAVREPVPAMEAGTGRPNQGGLAERLPSHPSAQTFRRAALLQMQRQAGNRMIQRQVVPDAVVQRSPDTAGNEPEPTLVVKVDARNLPPARVDMSHVYWEKSSPYDIGNDIVWVASFDVIYPFVFHTPTRESKLEGETMTGFISLIVADQALSKRPARQIIEDSFSLLESTTKLDIAGNQRLKLIEQFTTSLENDQRVGMSLSGSNFQILNYFSFKSRLQAQFEAQYATANLAEIKKDPWMAGSLAFASMDYPEVASKGGNGKGGTPEPEPEPETETKPTPVQPVMPREHQQAIQSVQKLVSTARKGESRTAHLPDRLVPWYSQGSGHWYVNVWANQDPQGKKKTAQAIRLKPGEEPEQLFERVQAAAAKAMLNEEDRQQKRERSEMPAWAWKLKEALEARLAVLRRQNKDAADLPDGLALGYGQKLDDPTHSAPNILLQVWVERISEGQVERNSAIIPWPLSPQTTVDELLTAVRNQAAVLSAWEKKPFGGQPPLPDLPGQSTTNEEMLHAFPAQILPQDLQPDGVTVTEGNNEFSMNLNYEAVYGGGPLKDLYIASRLSRETMWFVWGVYPVPADKQLTGGSDPLPANWEQRSRFLYDYFNNPRRPELPKLGKPSYQGVSRDSKERVKFPPQPGDYVVVCYTLHAPLGEHELRRASSVAYYPVRTRRALDLAGDVVNKIPNKIADLNKKLLGDASEADKAAWKEELARLNQQETQLLPERTADRLAEVRQKLKNLSALRETVAKQKTVEASRNANPLTWSLSKPLAELWAEAGANKEGLEPLRRYLEGQEKDLVELAGRVKEFSKNLDPASPNRFRPEVALVSEKTGQTYDLIMMLGEAKPPDEKQTLGLPLYTGPVIRYILADVTHPDVQKEYPGISRKKGEAGHREAIEEAFKNFGRNSEYAEGTILVRLPKNPKARFNPEIQPVYRSEPGAWKRFKKWLGILTMVAGLAALVLGTIATGGTLLAGVAAGLGIASTVGGSILAVENISERQAAHKLSFDAELMLDIIAIAGPAINAFARIPKLGAQLSRLGKLEELGELRVHPRWVAAIARSERFLYVYGAGEWAGTAILTSVKMMEDLDRIDYLHKNGKITKDQAERMRAMVFLEAMQSGAMLTIQVHQMRNAPNPFENDSYRSWEDRGWIDPKTQKVTDDAPPMLRDMPYEGPTRIAEPGAKAKPAVEGPGGSRRVPFASPEGEGGIHAPKVTEDGHQVGLQEEGLVRCSSCDLMRKTYDAALEEPANQGLRKELDDLEVDARKAAGNAEAESRVSDREKILEAKLAAVVDDYLSKHLNAAQMQQIKDTQVDPPAAMRLLKNGVAPDDLIRLAPHIETYRQLDDRLRGMAERGINPEDIGHGEKSWKQFLSDYENNPAKALKDLEGRLARHDARKDLESRQAGEPVGEPEGAPPGDEGPLIDIPGTPDRPQDLPEYQAAIEELRYQLASLRKSPGIKTDAKAAGGEHTRSGYKPGEKFPHAREASEHAVVEGHQAGHAPAEHPFDRAAKTGPSGIVRGSHAEKQAGILSPDTPVAVNRGMCSDCRNWFRRRAMDRGHPQMVADPYATRIFMPDGRVVFVPHPPRALTPRTPADLPLGRAPKRSRSKGGGSKGGGPKGGAPGGEPSGGATSGRRSSGSRAAEETPVRSAPPKLETATAKTKTLDEKHDLGMTDEGAIRCTSCDLMRRTYDAALDEHPDLRKQLDDLELEGQAAKGDPEKEKDIAAREQDLEAELAAKVTNYLKPRLNDEQQAIFREHDVDPPAVMRGLKHGEKADDLALLASYHGAPAVELLTRLRAAGSNADEALLTVMGIKSVKDTGEKTLRLLAERFEGGSRKSVVGEPDDPHELPQAIDFVKRQTGGGTFYFAKQNDAAGIEGLFFPTGAKDGIPISLKAFTSDSPRRVYNEANKNARTLRDLPDVGPGKAELFAYTFLSKKEIQDYFVNQPPGDSFALEVFKKMTFVCSDGVLSWDPSGGWR